MIMEYAKMERIAKQVQGQIDLSNDLGGGEAVELLKHTRTGGEYDVDRILDCITVAYYMGYLMGVNSK